MSDILSTNPVLVKLCPKCNENRCRISSRCCTKCHRTYHPADYNAETQRDRNLRKNYKITKEEYDILFFQQCGLCAVCGQPETVVHGKTKLIQPLSVDHNHETGEVRELLCDTCNKLLGAIEKDNTRVKKLLKYLKKHDRQKM